VGIRGDPGRRPARAERAQHGERAQPGVVLIHADLRAWVNLANGSTLAGLGVAALGGARVTRGPDRLFVGTGYRLPVPPAPAFCLGNVVITRLDGLTPELLRHEARHATQYACCGGVLMVPLYLMAAAASWMLTGDTGAKNVFERRAGLADGGYTDKPLRPLVLRAVLRRPASPGVSGHLYPGAPSADQ
jgi:hypothetical protein